MSVVVWIVLPALRPIPTVSVEMVVARDVLPAPRPVPTAVEAQLDATVVETTLVVVVTTAPRPEDATEVVVVVGSVVRTVAVVAVVIPRPLPTADVNPDDTVVVLAAPRLSPTHLRLPQPIRPP